MKEYHSKKGVLDLEWTTSAACPVSKDSPPPERGGDDNGDSEGSDSGGLGFFGWFFTLSAASRAKARHAKLTFLPMAGS